MPTTVSTWGSPVNLVRSWAPWDVLGTLNGALSKRWLQKGEARPRLLAGHLRPSHTWPDPLPMGASTAARLPVPLHSHLCVLRQAYCPPLEGPAPAVSSVGFLQGDLQNGLLEACPGRGLSSPCVSSQLSPAQHSPTRWRLPSPLTVPTLGHIPVTGLTLVTPERPAC